MEDVERSLKAICTTPQVVLLLINPYRSIYVYQCSPPGKIRKKGKNWENHTSGTVVGSKWTCKYAASVSWSILCGHGKYHQDPSSALGWGEWGKTHVCPHVFFPNSCFCKGCSQLQTAAVNKAEANWITLTCGNVKKFTGQVWRSKGRAVLYLYCV